LSTTRVGDHSPPACLRETDHGKNIAINKIMDGQMPMPLKFLLHLHPAFALPPFRSSGLLTQVATFTVHHPFRLLISAASSTCPPAAAGRRPLIKTAWGGHRF
jgi:hypothetical protein